MKRAKAKATGSGEQRSERLEVRLTPDEKDLLNEAARLGGEDVSTFVRRVAVVAARKLRRETGL